MNKYLITKLLAASIFLVTFSLVSCADKAGSGDKQNEVKKGGFIGNTIVGLTYHTDTQSGVTDAKGEFSYKEGESITFNLAGYALGTTVAVANMDIFDINGAGQPSLYQLTGYSEGSLNRGSDALVNSSLNTALLLHTLDDDGNPENGITLTANIIAALGNASYPIDFKTDSYQFTGNLRKVLKQANLDRAPYTTLSTIRSLVDNGIITTPLYRMVGFSYDNDADATIDNSNTFSYDIEGHLTQRTTDNNADGTVDTTDSYSFDNMGNMTGEITDTARISYSFDASGNMLKQEVDYRNDGTTDVIYTYTFNEQGERLTYSRDDNADGTANSIYTTYYDTQGNKSRYELDSDADGQTDRRYDYTYDEQGKRTQYQHDSNVDGTANAIYTFAYDAQGNRTIYNTDSDADGVIDSISTYTYDAQGNQSLARIDINADGIADQIYSRTFDSNGNMTASESDTDADGRANYSYSYTYDDLNRIVHSQREANSIASDVYIYVYASEGYLLHYSYDNNGDGTVDNLTTYTMEPTTHYGYSEITGTRGDR